MKTISIALPDSIFNPDVIIQSGQVFRMMKSDEPMGNYFAFSGDHAISFRKTQATQNGVPVWNFYVTDLIEWEFWEKYFDFMSLYSSYNDIIKASDDQFLKNALESCQGMRILRQDLWETMVTFIISQQNNIPKIKRTVEILCEKFGKVKSIAIDSSGRLKPYYAFPTIEKFANLSLSELQTDTMLGYRAKYILTLASDIKNGKFTLGELFDKTYDAAIRELKTINGVGDKVANCIALYGLHKMQGYPIDVWMQRILAEDYPQYLKWHGNGKQYYDTEKYMEYVNSSFSGFQGYVQQLQFSYKRQTCVNSPMMMRKATTKFS